jgi:hypothetical protein
MASESLFRKKVFIFKSAMFRDHFLLHGTRNQKCIRLSKSIKNTYADDVLFACRISLIEKGKNKIDSKEFWHDKALFYARVNECQHKKSFFSFLFLAFIIIVAIINRIHGWASNLWPLKAHNRQRLRFFLVSCETLNGKFRAGLHYVKHSLSKGCAEYHRSGHFIIRITMRYYNKG